MKAAEWRQKSDDELASELENLQKEAFNMRFQKANDLLENTSRVRIVRRDIARIRTIQAVRGAQQGEAPAQQGGGEA